MTSATVYCAGAAELGEGPRWLDGAGRLVWVDLLRARVLGCDAEGTERLVWQTPAETASAVVERHGGGYVVAMHRELALLDDTWVLRGTVSVPGLPDGHRLSDAAAGPDGALWVGAVPAGVGLVGGALYRVTQTGAAIALAGLGFSNGLGFSADGRLLFHIDSAANTLSAFEVDQAGGLGPARLVYRHSVPGETLDGLAVDARDRVWIAVFGGGRVLCVDADRGVVDEVTVPAPRVTSCAFGPDRTLFITTGTVEMTARERERHPLAGSVFVHRTAVPAGPTRKGML